MEAEHKRYNRIKCTADISAIMDKFYQNIAGAPSRGDKICWCSGASPYEMLAAQNVANFQTENHAARIASGQDHAYYIDKAESEGWPSDTCSYTRINIGVSLFLARGEIEKIHPRYRIPAPDFIFAGNTCPAMTQWGESLRRIFDVPMWELDCPFNYDDSDERYLENVKYIRSQLEDFVIFIEKNTGKPYNWDALKDIVFRQMRRVQQLRLEIMELCKRKPAIMSQFDAMIAMGLGHMVRTDTVIEFYEKMLAEIKERAKNGVIALPGEKYRLMWRGNFPWYAVGKMSRWMAANDICLATGVYGMGAGSSHANRLFPPDGFGTGDDPLTFIAWNVGTRGYTRTLEFKMNEEIEEFIKDWDIDGVCFHSPRSCRPWSMQEYDMANLVETRYGIPATVIEADHTDSRYYTPASVDLKLQALTERIKAGKEGIL